MAASTTPNWTTSGTSLRPTPGGRSRRWLALASAALVALSGCAGGGIIGGEEPSRTPSSSQTAPPAPDDADILLDLRTLGPGAIDTESLPTNDAIKATVLRRGDGRLRAVTEPTGASGVQFPSHADAVAGDLAAIRLSSPDGALDVGARDFTIGADVRLSADAVRSDRDDGDNVFQRGLFGSTGQFKVQLDNGRPSCRVKGHLGSVIVKSPKPVESERWYRLVCERREDAVTMFVAPITSGQSLEPKSWTIYRGFGRTGALRFSESSPFASIGAKINRRGGIVRKAPDQFNGSIDRVFLIDAGADDD